MKTEPFQHQRECLSASWNKKDFALFLEQGLGKTKIVLDTADALFAEKRIGSLLIVAPNGVHSNWVRREIPLHMESPRIVVEYSAKRMGTKHLQRDLYNLLYPCGTTRKLRILAVNVEAFSSPSTIVETAKSMLEKFPGLMVVDESTRIKTPGAARTKRVISVGRKAKYRRILTGTPVTQSPFDLYSQMGFLDYSVLGFWSFYAFRHNYGRFEKQFASRDGKTWEYESLIKYVRLDDLSNKIAPFSFRRLKRECIDLPEKIYKVYGIDLTPAQQKLYDRVLGEGVLEFEDLAMLTPLQITRLLRCQQIVGGFFPAEDPTDPVGARPIPGKNPKLDLLMESIEDNPGEDGLSLKSIVWARFRVEIAVVARELRSKYGHESVVELHGGVPMKNRIESRRRFQEDPSCRFLIGQQRSGIGVDLHAAETVYYYSNSFSYEERYQTEDRAHRIGLKHPVVYVDLVAHDTVDERIREVLHQSGRMADRLLDEGRRDDRTNQKSR